MHVAKRDFHRILIVQTAFIGDVILVTPLIRALKELYPNALLDVMVVPATAGLLHNNPHVNVIITFDKKGSRLSFLTIAKQLRHNRYDLAISPHSSFTTHFLLWLSGAKMRVGYARGFLSGLLMTHQVPHPKGIHKILKNLSLLKILSDRDFPMQTELFPAKKDLQTAAEILGESTNPLIAIAPGSIWATKCWKPEYYQELALNLSLHDYSLVLIGGASDAHICTSIHTYVLDRNPQAQIVNTADRSNLLTSAAIVQRAKLLICNDSGALHIANAMQTTVFAFFGPTVQRIGYFPYREGDHVFEVDLECRPCGSHGGNKCPLGHHNCMKLIKPEEVLAKVLETIKTRM